MDVYLVPTGRTRHELYCETAPAAAAGETPPPATLWQRMSAIFHRVLAEGERAREAPQDTPASHGRVRRFIVRKLSEAVAEQRLLWNLRNETAVRLFHPDDLSAAAAIDETRRIVGGDRDKHRRWAAIDGLLIVVSAPVALLPGPNVLAYYFIFRTVGHVLSMRGAQQALSAITWQPESAPPLTDLRRALDLEPAARGPRVEAVAKALGLDRLAAFIAKTAGA